MHIKKYGIWHADHLFLPDLIPAPHSENNNAEQLTHPAALDFSLNSSIRQHLS